MAKDIPPKLFLAKTPPEQPVVHSSDHIVILDLRTDKQWCTTCLKEILPHKEKED